MNINNTIFGKAENVQDQDLLEVVSAGDQLVWRLTQSMSPMFTGTVDPVSVADQLDGDLYINNANGKLFLFENGGWTLVTSLTIQPGGNPGDIQFNNDPNGLGGVTLVPLKNGGTHADLSATGGTSQVLKQTTAGGDIAVGQLAASDLSNGTRGSGKVILSTGLPYLNILDYGGAGDGTTDNTTPLNNAVAAAYAAGINTIYFPTPGKYVFNSKPANFPFGINIICDYSAGTAFGYGASLYVNYTESTPTNGFFTWDGANGTTAGNGGGIDGFLIWKPAPHTGGTALVFTGTTSTNRSGFCHVNNIRITGDGTWNKDVLVDGSAITTSGSQGIRDLSFFNCFFFGATDPNQSIHVINGAHIYFTNVLVNAGSGSNCGITITGSAGDTSTSQLVYFANTEIGGNLVLDYANQVVGSSMAITGTASDTANTTNSFISGFIGTDGFVGSTGYISEDSLGGSFGFLKTRALRSTTALISGPAIPTNLSTGDIVASNSTTQGSVKLGSDGEFIFRRAGANLNISFDAFSSTPFQFNPGGLLTTLALVAGGTAPSNLTAGDLVAGVVATPTQGSLVLGSDGLCRIRRNNGSGAGTNIALNFDAFSSAAPFNFDNADGFNTTLPITPTTAGGTTLGLAALPFSAIYVGAAATNNVEITATTTGARVFTLPNANLNLSAATAGGGVPQEVFQILSPSLTANYNSGTAKTLFTPSVPGMYRVIWSQAIIVVDGASSTFPSLTLSWTDVGGIARTKQLIATSGTNTTAVESDGTAIIYTNNSTAVQITSASYASGTPGTMTYALAITAESL